MIQTLPLQASRQLMPRDVFLFSCFKLFVVCVLLGSSMHAQNRQETMRIVTFKNAPSAASAMRLSGGLLKIDATQDLKSVSKTTDRLGFTHERLQQYHQGIKVEHAVWAVHSKHGKIVSMSGNAAAVGNVNTFFAITEEKALQATLDHVNAKRYRWQHFGNRHLYPKGEKVIFKGLDGKKEPRLCFKFDIYAVEPLYRADVYVDAISGEVLGENNMIHEADVSASGTTLYNGNRNFTADSHNGSYRLRQASSGNGIETFNLNGSVNYNAAVDVTSATTNFSTNSTAVQAHWASEQVFNYYLQDHSRNSYDGNGSVLRSYVSYSTNYANAFWDGSKMTYGDGNGTTYGKQMSHSYYGRITGIYNFALSCYGFIMVY